MASLSLSMNMSPEDLGQAHDMFSRIFLNTNLLIFSTKFYAIIFLVFSTAQNWEIFVEKIGRFGHVLENSWKHVVSSIIGRDPLMALGGQLTKFSGEIGPTI